MKTILGIYSNPNQHWVGDGFPVRSLFSYSSLGAQVSPFLLLDYAGPYNFAPTTDRRGVGQHPHRGFETVTIVYDGEVEHKDSAGNGGIIGPGDVQWMTAAGGILHEEYHSPAFGKTGGPFRMVQLWVNLPAALKMTAPRYTGVQADAIPAIPVADGQGTLNLIAGTFAGVTGPIRSLTGVFMSTLRLSPGARIDLPAPQGRSVFLYVVSGHPKVSGADVAAWHLVTLAADGDHVALAVPQDAGEDAVLLFGHADPIGEPVVAHGPFVMNTREEIGEAIRDYQAGKFNGTGPLPAVGQ